MTESVECAVIGAGVVGLAVARALAEAGREVIVLEAADAIGTETSSRNSEVIHAGLYYRPGSLKARACVAGKHALYDYCDSHGVPYSRCGKLVVATNPAESERLARIVETAAANGVTDLRWMDGAEAGTLEPALRCEAAFLSPSTGIIDSHALMLALQGDAEAAGAMIAFHAPVEGGAIRDVAGIRLEVGGESPMNLDCRLLVNAAGLGAQAVSRALSGLDPATVPDLHLSRGAYFVLGGPSPFSHLIYPTPVDGGLGVHVTLDLAGQCRFGPDVEWIDRIDYSLDPARADRFYGAVRRYWPDLPDGALQPGYTGIRPHLGGPGVAPPDFMIQDERVHHVPGFVALYGMESPGLTACLALADMVRDRLTLA